MRADVDDIDIGIWEIMGTMLITDIKVNDMMNSGIQLMLQ